MAKLTGSCGECAAKAPARCQYHAALDELLRPFPLPPRPDDGDDGGRKGEEG